MRPDNLGGYRTIDAYVNAKSAKLRAAKKDFDTLFELMFSESENILWEKSRGFKTFKTRYGDAKKEISELIPKFAKALEASPRGSLVGLCLPNSLEWIEALWSILASGYRVLLVNPRLPLPVLLRTLSENGVACVITGEAENPFAGASGLPFEELAFAAVRASEPREYVKVPFGTEILVMSSGTSAHVKCCAYGAAEIAAQILDSSRIIHGCADLKKHYKGELKQLALLPFCHIFGLTAVYFWFAFFSRTFVELGSLAGRDVANTVRRHRVTHIFAVPMFWNTVYKTVWDELKERKDGSLEKVKKGLEISRKLDFCPPLRRLFAKYAFEPLRDEIFGESISYFICGGSAVKPEILEFFSRIGYPISDGYGMSEIGITSVELRERVRMSSPCSVGQTMTSVKYSRGDNGHLFVSGSSLAKYIVCGGERRELPSPFDTGDLVSCDEKRDVYEILGRSDELVIGQSGENLNPGSVEEACACEGAQLCFCAVNDGQRTAPALVVSLSPRFTAEKNSLIRDEILSKLEKTGLLPQTEKIIYTVTPLCGENDFKLNRRKVAEAAAAGLLVPADFEKNVFEADNSGLEMKIRSAFAAVLGLECGEIEAGADFFSVLGGSSLDFAAVTAELSAELGINIPASPAGISTVSGLYAYAEAQLEKASH